MTKILGLAVLLVASTVASTAFAGTTFTGIACAMRADADVIVAGLANMPALTIDADISQGPSLVADTDACVSLEADADLVAGAKFTPAQGGEQIGLAQIGGQHFVFVDGIPPNF